MSELPPVDVTDPVLAAPQPREVGPPRVEQMLDAVSNDLRKTIQHQHLDEAPDHSDFYSWGWGLTELLDRIKQAAVVLDRQTEAYAQRQDLLDDEGWDPATRLATAGDELREALAPARAAVRRFHSAIAHVGTKVPGDQVTDGDA